MQTPVHAPSRVRATLPRCKCLLLLSPPFAARRPPPAAEGLGNDLQPGAADFDLVLGYLHRPLREEDDVAALLDGQDGDKAFGQVVGMAFVRILFGALWRARKGEVIGRTGRERGLSDRAE